MSNEILVEFLEVITNQVLYLRGLYPLQIFKKHKCYSLPVVANVYPPLASYIKNILLETLTLLNDNKLKRFEIRIHKNEKVLESFVIDLNWEASRSNLSKLEETFQSCIHALESRCKMFKKVSRDSRFKILLHADSSHDFTSDSRSLDFLWIKDYQKVPETSKGIVPIVMDSEKDCIRFYVEKF